MNQSWLNYCDLPPEHYCACTNVQFTPTTSPASVFWQAVGYQKRSIRGDHDQGWSLVVTEETRLFHLGRRGGTKTTKHSQRWQHDAHMSVHKCAGSQNPIDERCRRRHDHHHDAEPFTNTEHDEGAVWLTRMAR